MFDLVTQLQFRKRELMVIVNNLTSKLNINSPMRYERTHSEPKKSLAFI